MSEAVNGNGTEQPLKKDASTALGLPAKKKMSAITSKINTPRKVFRILVYLIFTTAFTYQVIKFLCYILLYPTVVDISIASPKSYLTPAFTFCSNNKIKRSKFCAKYPHYCMRPDKSFCEKHSMYCGDKNTKVPKPEYYDKELDLEVHEIMELGYNISDLYRNEMIKEAPDGPHVRTREKRKSFSVCYSVYSRVDNSLDAHVTETSIWNFPVYEFSFNVDESDTFNPNTHPGILFTMHSPYEAANPFNKGIFMKPGTMYKVFFSMRQEKLLPSPYPTDCVNYTAIWAKNKKMGPRSQEICLEKCFLNITHDCANCTGMDILYPYKGRTCNIDESVKLWEPCALRKNPQICYKQCKDDCSKNIYRYEAQERFLTKMRPSKDGSDTEDRSIYVEVEMENKEVITLYHKPQYQEVEAFSYIGGFIGIWLGVSLVQVADFFESIFRIGRFYCRKRPQASLRRASENL